MLIPVTTMSQTVMPEAQASDIWVCQGPPNPELQAICTWKQVDTIELYIQIATNGPRGFELGLAWNEQRMQFEPALILYPWSNRPTLPPMHPPLPDLEVPKPTVPQKNYPKRKVGCGMPNLLQLECTF